MELQLGGKNKGTALVSVVDFDFLSKYKWTKDDRGYVSGRVNGKLISLHHCVMNAEYGQMVDHINGIKTDNRRENLRFSAYKPNAQNLHLKKDGKSSKYRGVSKKKGRYIVRIIIDYKEHYLGSYDNELKAAEALDMFIVHSGLDHIELNFPDKKTEYLSREYKPKQSTKETEYVGVCKSGNKYMAKIYNKSNIYLGTFDTAIKAAQTYDDYIVKKNITGKQLNFPDRYPSYGKENPILVKCEIISETVVKLSLNYKTHKFSIIDKSDYENIKYFKCGINGDGYVTIKINKKAIRLSRFLMGVTDPKIFVDHTDGDPLNNTRKNLRISNYQKNSQNKNKKESAGSKYYGVYYLKSNKMWCAMVGKDYKNKYIISHPNEIICARAHDLYILEHMKDDHYRLNFEWSDNDIIEWTKKINILNSLIKTPKTNKLSKYTGVTYEKKTDRWVSVVKVGPKFVHKKRFGTEEQAARSRDLYIITHLKNSGYRLNFIWSDGDIDKWKKILRVQ